MRIKALNKLAKECRMFNEHEKVEGLYEMKLELIKKHGKPKRKEWVGGMETIVFSVYGSLFHIPTNRVPKHLKVNLKTERKKFNNKIDMRY